MLWLTNWFCGDILSFISNTASLNEDLPILTVFQLLYWLWFVASTNLYISYKTRISRKCWRRLRKVLNQNEIYFLSILNFPGNWNPRNDGFEAKKWQNVSQFIWSNSSNFEPFGVSALREVKKRKWERERDKVNFHVTDWKKECARTYISWGTSEWDRLKIGISHSGDSVGEHVSASVSVYGYEQKQEWAKAS